MVTLKKMMLASCAVIALSGSVYATDWTTGYDKPAMQALIEETKAAFSRTTECFEGTRSAYVKAKDYSNALRGALKAQSRLIKERLKRVYKEAKLAGDASFFQKKQTYKAYKALVYKNWKKTGLLPSL